MERVNRLTRSKNGMIGGVLAGIADYTGLNITSVRIAYILISVLSKGFPGILVYIILWAVMPKEN